MKTLLTSPRVTAFKSNRGALLASTVIFITGVPAGFAQTNVFSRSDSGTGLWENNSNVPWFYQADSVNRGRPDANVSSTTRHNVFIGHNSNTTMDVNSTSFYLLRSLTLESGTTFNRTFNSNPSSGISLTDGLYINSGSGSHTFNNQFGVDASTVNFTNNGGTASFTNNIFLNANTAVFSGSSNINVSGILGGGSPTGGGISKLGAGTITLTGDNTYTGTTTISSGTLLLGAANRIANSSNVTLGGGTFGTGGFSETVGKLTLNDNSIIDLGAGASTLNFASSASANSVTWAAGKILSIYNWSGSTGGGGTDRVLFGSSATGLEASQLAQISFYSGSGTGLLGGGGARILSSGEIVPVPEPSTWIGAGLITGLFVTSQRKRLSELMA